MIHIDPLQVVLERLGCADPAKGAFFFWDEVKDWPSGALETLVACRLLQPAQPMTTIECDGCEEHCINKPVVVYPALEDKPGRGFIVCDEREGMGRIRVSFERMKQWRCSIDSMCGFIAARLGLRPSHNRVVSADLMEIGMVTGDKRSQMLCLQTNGVLALVAGNNRFPLVDLIEYHDGEYSFDDVIVRQLVDAATTSDSRYTPSNAKREASKLETQNQYQAWQKAYRALKRKRPGMSDVWYSQQIEKTHNPKGRDADTIREHMKK